MRIGKMNRRITLLKPVREEDEYGGAKTVYISTCTLWAEFLRPNFREQTLEGAGSAVILTQGIRLRPIEVEKEWRVECGERLYNVLHVDASVPSEIILTTHLVMARCWFSSSLLNMMSPSMPRT